MVDTQVNMKSQLLVNNLYTTELQNLQSVEKVKKGKFVQFRQIPTCLSYTLL